MIKEVVVIVVVVGLVVGRSRSAATPNNEEVRTGLRDVLGPGLETLEQGSHYQLHDICTSY